MSKFINKALVWYIIALVLFTTACTSPTITAAPTTLPEEIEGTYPPPERAKTPSPSLAPALTHTPTSTPSTTLTQTPEPIRIGETLSEVAYNLPLTIRHLTETSATMFFELDTPSEGILLYWPSGEEDQQSLIPFSTTETRHLLTLKGLAPGTEYQAVVGISAGPDLYRQPHFMEGEWGTVKFHTASDKLPLRVGVIGDSGLGEQSTLELTEQMAAHDLDFVLHTGDVVYLMGSHPTPFEAYGLKYYATFAPLLHEMPVYPVVGNHELDRETLWQGTPFYYYAFPPFSVPGFEASDYYGRSQWYAVAYGQVQFLLLDTQTFFGEDGRIEQDAWLEERLADDRFDYTIPVFHVPPYSSGPHASEGPVVRQSWVPLFAGANVPVVFSGHDHFYERLSAEDITYIVSGGGSSTLYNIEERRPESQIFSRRMHFVLMEIYEDRIELSAIAPDGEIFDRVTIPLELLNMGKIEPTSVP